MPRTVGGRKRRNMAAPRTRKDPFFLALLNKYEASHETLEKKWKSERNKRKKRRRES